MHSYSLDNLDVKIEKYLNFNNGFFVEAGANNGILQSNTLYYEKKYNWSGILIEPNYESYIACKTNRPNCIVEHCALVSNTYTQNYIEGTFLTKGGTCGLSLMEYVTDYGDQCDEAMKEIKTIKKNNNEITKVPAKKLQDILNANNIRHIDLFSLDVEGYEISVLNGLDFNCVSPTYILLETSSDESRINLLSNYLNEKNYTMIERVSKNDHLFKFKG
jgi:FkbM family methyltransferase